MKKNVILMIIVLVLAALACGGSKDPEVNPPSGDSNQQSQPEEVKVGTARSNPAPVGSEVVIDDMTFTVLGVTRPANEIIEAGNMFNSEPEAGQEYILVEIKITCNKDTDSKCSITPSIDFNVIGDNGIEYDPEIMISGVDGLLSSTEFYGGATLTGKMPFIVEQGEGNLVLIYDPIFGNNFYLQIP